MNMEIRRLTTRNGGSVTVELITPQRAEEMINQNTCNRSLRPGIVERYAADMAAGRWTECTAQIVFYEDNAIADGQHRLYAIVMSGTAQEFTVRRGLKRESGLNIDTGTGRKLVDNARISGADTSLSNELISVTRGIEDGDAKWQLNRARTGAERIDIVARHREAGEWAVHHGPKTRGTRNAIVLSAIGRAWYAEPDKEKLERFCAVLDKGLSESKTESAAVVIRNYLIAGTAKRGSLVTGVAWRDTFLKVQNAIAYFMRGKPLTVIKAIADETYPAPGQRQQRASQKPTTVRGRKAERRVGRRGQQASAQR